MKTFSVALHMSLNTFHRLELAQGVIQYAREQPQWRVFGSFYTSKPVLDYQSWGGHGIIAICHRHEEAAPILATGLPVVDVVRGFVDKRIVNVTSDNLDAGRRAGQHLLSTGFMHFAFCHISGTNWSELRGEGFADAVGVPLSSMPVFEHSIAWWQNHGRSRALEKFLLGLPTNTAILAGNDNAGVKITEACQHCGRKVPDDLVVMGIDGDDLQCELSFPPLSTIPINGIRIGYEAAKRLDALMRDGKKAPREHVRLPNKGVVVRGSSDTLACGDDAVRRAVMFIRQNFSSNLSVPDVARAAVVCRRTLELRFRRERGHSILEEIQASRLRYAKNLLESTDLPVSKIYPRCGFMTHQIFYAIFRKHTGLTPQQYRKRRQAAALSRES